MKINQVNLHRNYLYNKSNIDSAIAQCIANSEFINGSMVDKFEREFSKYTGEEACAGVSSGTSALHLSLLALGIGDGDEVIVPSLTFFATAEAVSQVGATPVFVDVDVDYYLFDINNARKLITSNTKAIITVDLYGQPLNNKQVRIFCDDNNLHFIQDCAHSPGAKYDDEPTSKYSDLACWSFYPGKNLDCMGDGGAITGSSELITKVQYLKDHARIKRYHHTGIGWSSRLDGIQASILIEKLKLLDEENSLRRKHAEFYNSSLIGLQVKLPKENNSTYHVYHQYIIITEKRDELLSFAETRGITLGIHYPVPCHKQPVYDIGLKLPVSEYITKSCISLPVHPYLTTEERDYIVDVVVEFFNQCNRT